MTALGAFRAFRRRVEMMTKVRNELTLKIEFSALLLTQSVDAPDD
jgi:hypothetical protein